ncbi:sugar ABC transporter ATP-binding protein [Mesorhizobium erdmanii]|uniref:Sugar ABC transporter ATP-binding protein n=1 Tax=Mesorhizobium erdmanii TaxID=1777866 RepID=A0A6M7UHU6_9HYPH|nr:MULTISPECIES: sugar ABC transporter ATP-binding protein [Mesorhizobium]OBQ70449.1 ABC transporter ATP-binding protein [Mesorhizobium loti]QKC76346.1 sugar ABC transporter ATP-binding protein [Mesorhizobium erdmanii]
MSIAVNIAGEGGSTLPCGDVPGAVEPVVRAERLSKQYGPVTVLSDVMLDILPGEIHAIIGENGAGKSTLMRLLSGYVEPTGGTLSMAGHPVKFTKPSQAQDAGIALVHQEILLADGLTVADNLFLGRELLRGPVVDDRTMRRLAAEKLAQIGCFVSPTALVRDISLADRQMVQIARALLDDYKVVIFDEPTAVLTGGEVERLLEIVLQLKAHGTAVLYISHRLDEVQRVADKVTVLRDGKMVGTYPGKMLNQTDMARLMVGRELAALYPERTGASSDIPMLSVSNATVPGYAEDVSFTLHKGEILGFAGMVGAGRTELFEGIVGLRPATATVELEGKPVHFHSQRAAIDAGIGYLTEDRKGKGLLLQERLAANLTLSALDVFHPGLSMSRGREMDALEKAIEAYDIRVKSPGAKAAQLSGGNQQKLLLAKVLLTNPSVVIIDEPTRGIDIANKAQIYAFIHGLVARGKACIVISSEMQELIGLCDRILVMREGHVTGEVSGAEMTESNVALLATSGPKPGPKAKGGTEWLS